MSTFPLVTALLAVCVASGVVGLQNDYDGNLYVACNKYNGEALYRVYSRHSNRKEDRRWHWSCRRVIKDEMSHCSWTKEYINDWDDPMAFHCKHNHVISGVSSRHNNKKEDRRWKVLCCRANGYRTRSCGISKYINNWDGEMKYTASAGRVFTGLVSVHSNKKEDRRWKVNTCQFVK